MCSSLLVEAFVKKCVAFTPPCHFIHNFTPLIRPPRIHYGQYRRGGGAVNVPYLTPQWTLLNYSSMMTPRSSLHCKTLVVCLAPGFGCADNKDSSNHTFAGAYGFGPHREPFSLSLQRSHIFRFILANSFIFKKDLARHSILQNLHIG